jgi:hypothetical protein
MSAARTDLAELQRHTFGYFVHEANPANGLVRDNTRYGSTSSIAAVGLGLACWPIAVERGVVKRVEAVQRVLATLRFFAADAPGQRGFFFHFLDLATGSRAHGCEVSTMDTAILLAGALTATAYFDGEDVREREIREHADALYRAADWQWAFDGGPALRHGWTPENGFLPYHWRGYSEAMLLYVLGLGSPTHPLPPESWAAWTETYRWSRVYGIEYLSGGPLFMHQLSHLWIDFRGIRDSFMRERGIDYFENSRRATLVQQRYAEANPRKFRGYSKDAWGITASDGPGPAVRRVDGRVRRFYDYCPRGVPDGPDDGTLSPWAVVASLPFAPEVVLPTLDAILRAHPSVRSRYGLLCSFNPTFGSTRGGWIAKGYYGLDQGPVVIMIENFLTGMTWDLMRGCEPVVRGLRRAGFSGGWMG